MSVYAAIVCFMAVLYSILFFFKKKSFVRFIFKNIKIFVDG